MEMPWTKVQHCIMCILLFAVVLIADAAENDSAAARNVTEAPVLTTTPVPGPNFVVKENGEPCLRAGFKAEFTIRYNSKIPRGYEQLFITVVLPEAVDVTGTCGNTTSSLTLSWHEDDYQFTIQFSKTADDWKATEMSIKINTSNIEEFVKPLHVGSHLLVSEEGKTYFQAATNRSYECDTAGTRMHEYSGSHVNRKAFQYVDVDMTDLKIQAFDLPETAAYGEADTCPSKKIRSNAVPMIVAGCLACLILVIIVAYSISKNKNKITYKSVD